MNEPFGSEKSEQYNAVYTAIIECGKDYDPEGPPGYACYSWFAECGKSSITAELVNKMNEHGFKIIRYGKVRDNKEEREGITGDDSPLDGDSGREREAPGL